MTLAPEDVKACCAAAYASEAARFLLGDSFHPGGAALTSRLIAALRVGPGATVVDVASGPGTTALQLVQETGCDVIGVDLSPESVAAAAAAAAQAGLTEQIRFRRGDAEALPLPDASTDGALCECALCTFPDKEAAAAELARVLRPGARLALSDVTADPARLPAELTSLAGWVACVADARPLEEIAELLAGAGLTVEAAEPHDSALAKLLERVEARLRLARLILDGGVERGLGLVGAARAALAEGTLGYGVVIARR
jgi:arsenite methyltransferase